MEFELISKENLDIAIKIQNEIFPLENGSEDYKESISGELSCHRFLLKYWLAKVDTNMWVFAACMLINLLQKMVGLVS